MKTICLAFAVCVLGSGAVAMAADPPAARPGVEGKDGQCPKDAPIKGNWKSKKQCIYHTSASKAYEKTKAERCYASEDDAKKDGCRAPKK